MTTPTVPDQPHQPVPTDPEPAPGTVSPDPTTDPNHPDFDPDVTPDEEGEKYDGGDIPQTGTESDENQTTE